MAAPATSGQLRTRLQDMEIGDYISCEYGTASSTVAGNFSNFGKASKAEIPFVGSAVPNGTFYFIKVDKGLIISDRVLHTNIRWVDLNNKGVIEGILGMGNSIIPTMTSDTAPEGIVTYSTPYSTYVGWRAFNDLYYPNDTYYLSATAPTVENPHWLAYEFTVPKIIKAYAYKNINNVPGSCAKTFNFEAWDGSAWIALHTGSLSFADDAWHYYEINNNNAYAKYRIIAFTTFGGWFAADGFKMFDSLEGNSYLIRSLSGGVTWMDAIENPTTTEPSLQLGAWPSSNEWDKYIVNSDLGGKIIAGDNNVWHWQECTSFFKETPHRTLREADWCIRRGKNNIIKGFDKDVIKSGSYDIIGFRPVLEYIDLSIPSNRRTTTLWY